MNAFYWIAGYLVVCALIMMVTRRAWCEWDPSEPRPNPTPDRPAEDAVHA